MRSAVSESPTFDTRQIRESLITEYEIVQCFPVQSLLEATRVNHIDLFSLDIEGSKIESKVYFEANILLLQTLKCKY